MSSVFRKSIVAAGAAALISSQAIASAAPVGPALDPLVSLSVLGSAQSHAALCAGTAAATAAAAAAAQGPAPGCVLPVMAAPPPPPVTTSAVAPPPPPGKSLGIWPILLGLAAIAALAALLLDGGDGDGDIEPISP